MPATSPIASSSASPEVGEVRAYISDMLSQLADLAGGAGERQLEKMMRLLALEAAAGCTATPPEAV